VKGLTSGFIPVIVMIVFIIIVKLVFRKITVASTISWQRLANSGVSNKFFLFSIINIFLGFTISGMLIDSWDDLTSGELSLSEILELFAISIPKQSTYFISFFIVKTFSGLPLILLNIGPLIVGELKVRYMSNTERARQANMKPMYKPFEYDLKTADPLLFLLIGMAYSTISPLIVPFAIIYFTAAQIVFRYRFMYCHERPYQTTGSMWPHQLNRIFFILNMYIVFMAVIFGIQKGYQAVPTLIMFPAALYYQYLLKKEFYPTFLNLPKELLESGEELAQTMSPGTSIYDPPALKDAETFMDNSVVTVI